MTAPARTGVDVARWQRELARLDRARAAALFPAQPADLDGRLVLWSRDAANRVTTATLHIQPGVADDLPSLLSALAAEIGWPGVPEAAAGANATVAVWARSWQTREAADLRVTLCWDRAGAFHAAAELRGRGETAQPLLDTPGMTALLDAVALTPRASVSPHGLLLAGNRAMQAGDFAAACADYRRAAEELPRHPEAHRNLALALARLGEWEAAVQAMDAAVTLAPRDVALRAEYLVLVTDAGVDAVRRHALDEAAGHFLHILTHWPDEPTALANLGNIRLREGRFPEARAIYRRFLRRHPDHPAVDTIRLALAELGEEPRTD